MSPACCLPGQASRKRGRESRRPGTAGISPAAGRRPTRCKVPVQRGGELNGPQGRVAKLCNNPVGRRPDWWAPPCSVSNWAVHPPLRQDKLAVDTLRVPVKSITRTGLKPITESGQAARRKSARRILRDPRRCRGRLLPAGTRRCAGTDPRLPTGRTPLRRGAHEMEGMKRNRPPQPR